MKLKTKFIVVLMCLVSVCCMAVFLSGCDGLGFGSLSAPTNIKYDGATVTWDAVEGAEKYSVKINDGASFIVPTNTYGYTANGSQFTISVSGVKGDKDGESTSNTFTYLGKVEDSSIAVTEEGVVTWNGVAGATAYELKSDVNGQAVTLYNTEYTLPVGTTKFQVRPVVSGDPTKYSTWSTTKTLVKLGTLDTQKISYDGAYITFDAVSSAYQYEVYIDGVAQSPTTGRKFAFEADNSDFNVAIKALGNHSTSFDGEKSDEKKFVFLDMVTGLKVSDGVLAWDGSDDKTYKLKIGTKEVEVTGSTYDKGDLPVGKSVDVCIKEISKDTTYFSSYTTPISMFILPSPELSWSTLTSLDGGENSLSWNAVAGATGYTVNLKKPNGEVEPFAFGEAVTSFANEYEDIGDYEITVIANANENDGVHSNSKPSKVFYVTRPAKPDKSQSNFITSDASNISKGFTVTVDAKLGYKYQLFKNDTEDGSVSSTGQFKRDNLIETTVLEAQSYTYSIKVIGEKKASNRVLLNSKENLEFTISILEMPQNVHMDGFNLLYDSVVGDENGYWITGVNGGNGTSGTSNGAELSAYLKAGNYELQVCAKGNGSDVLASNYSPIVKVVRLGAPTNIRIDTNTAQNGVLKYDVSDMSQGVELYLGSKDMTTKVESSENVLENMNDQIAEGGTYVSLVAVANYLAANGTYYISSEKSVAQEFVKIPAPTNLSFDNTHLKWNQTGISQARLGAITYEIYNESDVVARPAQNDRSVDISQLEGGREYTFKIRAIGDGVKYINSELSTADKVYKLATPEVERVDGKYVWNNVTNTSTYSVTVDGKVFSSSIHVSGNTNDFDPKAAFEQAKTYTVVFVAEGNNGIGENKTISSKPCTITQETYQLAKPEFSLSYESNEEYQTMINDVLTTVKVYDTQGEVVTTITKTVPYSTGYRYLYNSITKEKTGEGCEEFKSTSLNAGKIDVYVNALGGMFDADGKYTLTSPNSSKGTITLLATPDKNSVTLNTDGYISFTPVEGANKYDFEIELNGSVVGKFSTTSASLDLASKVNHGEFAGITNYNQVSSVKITLYAVGTLNNVITAKPVVVEKTGNLHG